MERPGVLVVGETPSLGRSIADLLESGAVPAHYVLDLASEEPLADLAGRYRVVVAACNGPYGATARQWARGELSNVELVVVGARDPGVIGGARLHLVELPLLPAKFLAMVRDLLETPTTRIGSGARVP